MFCEKCGAQLGAGMKFCTACGAPVGVSAPEQGAPAPVNDGGTGAVNDLMNSYYRAAQGTQPSAAPASAPVQQGAPVQGAAFPQGAQFQGYPYGAPMQNTGIPAQGANPCQGIPQQPGVMPEVYSAYPQAVKPIKKPGKFRKFLPAACIAGGVVVLAGTGLIVYNCNKAFFTHSALGDAGYAHEMVIGTLTSGKTGEILNKSLNAAGNMMSAQSAINRLYYDSGYDTYYNYKDTLAMEYYSQILQSYIGTSGVQMTVSADVQLSSDGKDAIESLIGSSVDIDEILKSVSDLKFTAAEKVENDTIEGAASLTIGSDTIAAVQVRYEKDGTYTVILPGISDIGIKGELPTLDTDSRTSGTVSSYDFIALEQKIKQKTRPLFENYKYKYTTGSDLVRGVEFDGMKVEITLNVADAYEFYNVVLEVMKNDSGFVRYMSEISGTDTDDFVSGIEYIIENNNSEIEYFNEYYDGGDEYRITAYMNSNNTLAGVGIKMDDVNTVFISNGKDAAFSYKEGDTEYVRFNAEGKSASEGTAKLVINGGYYSSTQTYTVDYKNFGMMTAFGMPCIKGDFEMSLDAGELYDISSDLGRTGGAKLLLSISPNGQGMKISFGVSSDDYGKVMLNIDYDAAGTVAPKPGNNYKLYDPTDSDMLSEINSDLMDHIGKLAEKYAIIDSIYTPTVKGYIDSDRVTAANSTAAAIKNNVSTFLTNADTSGYGMKFGDYNIDSLDITVSGGVWSCTSADSDNYRTGSNIVWGGGARGVTSSDSKDNVYNAETLLCIELARLFPDMNNAAIHVVLTGGMCTAVAYTSDQTYLVEGVDMPYIYNGFFNDYFEWNGKTAGITSSGIVVGTSPAVPLRSYYNYY